MAGRLPCWAYFPAALASTGTRSFSRAWRSRGSTGARCSKPGTRWWPCCKAGWTCRPSSRTAMPSMITARASTPCCPDKAARSSWTGRRSVLKKSRRIDFMRNAPLPMRGGVAPSRVYLPAGPWTTLLEFLIERFKHVPPSILQDRLARGEIVDEAGVPQTPDASYKGLRWLWYYREVPLEADVPFELPILFRDRQLVAVDKTHFLASTPGGRYLRGTALARLRLALDMPLLSPIHRLDRDTAGVLLFCADPEVRGAYQALFQTRDVHKEYEALSPVRADVEMPMLRRSLIQPRPGHFTMQEVDGQPNSETYIELLSVTDGRGLFRLRPRTG